MAVKQYIGARYVPLIIGEWDSATAYDPLSIVTNNGNSYTSKVKVPVGTPLSDTKYWCLTGNFNAQLQYVSNSLAGMKQVFDDMKKVFNEMMEYPKYISETETLEFFSPDECTCVGSIKYDGNSSTVNVKYDCDCSCNH